MLGYRSGHNEAVLKTVCYNRHGGSNPFPSAYILVAQWNRAQRYERWTVAGSSPVGDTLLEISSVG